MRQRPPQYQYEQPLDKQDVKDMYEYGTFSPNKAIIGVAAIAVTGFFLYRFATKLTEKKAKAEAVEAVTENNNAQIALALKDAIFNVGIPGVWATFDEEKAFQLADRITSMKEVRKYYKSYHNRDLDEDLQAQANANELVEFMRRANKPKSQAEVETATAVSNPQYTNSTNVKPGDSKGGKYREDWIGKIARLTQAANIRKKPETGGDNILVPMKDVVKGFIVGLLTGKITDNGYVEIFVRFDTDKPLATDSLQRAYRNIINPLATFDFFSVDYKKEIKNKGILVYVHKDYIEDASKYNIKGSQAGYSAESTEISLKGATGTSTKLVVKPNHRATIYDNAMRKRGTATDIHCLGYLVSTLNGKNGSMYQFVTRQGRKRWVNANSVNLV